MKEELALCVTPTASSQEKPMVRATYIIRTPNICYIGHDGIDSFIGVSGRYQ